MASLLQGPFRFDHATHRYTVGDQEVPGIHAVLRTGGVERGGPWLEDPAYRERGRAVHRATLAHDLGDDVRLAAEWRPFFDAYLAVLAALRCRWRYREHPRVHRRLRYASLLDAVGTVNGRPAVVEIKTGEADTFHGPQLAGADLLLPGGGVRSPRARLAFYLRADGTFRVREYTSWGDYVVFTDALDAYWRERR